MGKPLKSWQKREEQEQQPQQGRAGENGSSDCTAKLSSMGMTNKSQQLRLWGICWDVVRSAGWWKDGRVYLS